MKTYPYQDGDQLIELVEKREYDLLALALHDAHNRIEDAVRRMEYVPLAHLHNLYTNSRTIRDGVEAVRTRLIKAAKGEQP